MLGAGPEGLHAYLLCDGCLPPPAMAGSRSALSRMGWRFDDFMTGPHLCPSCAYRGAHTERLRRGSSPSARPALPNVLVIGATKSATTAVHRFLSEHPEIDMAAEKELNFFLNPLAADRLDEYATFFDGDFPIRGETSPLYAYSPNLPGVPGRIQAAIPRARLVYLVRDPVDRALSDYAHYSAIWGPPDTAFEHPDDEYNIFTAPSMYARQLTSYLAEFSPDQILVIDQAELLVDGAGTMRAIFRFLDVDDAFTSPRFEERINPAEDRRRMPRMGRWLRRSPLASGLSRVPARPREFVLDRARRLILRPPSPRPDPAPDLREVLRTTFAEDAARLRDLTGLEFRSWQV